MGCSGTWKTKMLPTSAERPVEVAGLSVSLGDAAPARVRADAVALLEPFPRHHDLHTRTPSSAVLSARMRWSSASLSSLSARPVSPIAIAALYRAPNWAPGSAVAASDHASHSWMSAAVGERAAHHAFSQARRRAFQDAMRSPAFRASSYSSASSLAQAGSWGGPSQPKTRSEGQAGRHYRATAGGGSPPRSDANGDPERAPASIALTTPSPV